MGAGAENRKEEQRTWAGSVAGHAADILLVLLLHFLLHGAGQLVHLQRLVGALKLPVAVLPAQVAVLVILQRACTSHASNDQASVE